MDKYISVGTKIGVLTIIEFSHKDKWGDNYFKCECDCTNIKVVSYQYFRKNKYYKCRPRNKEAYSKTSIYHVWEHMKTRCYNSNHVQYKNYGGRGI